MKVVYKKDLNEVGKNLPCFFVLLSDGSRVDVGTKEGANALLRGSSNIDYFSNAVKELKKIRSKPRVTMKGRERHMVVCSAISKLSAHADRGVFRERFPESEIQYWMDYTMEEVTKLTTNSKWTRFGDLNDIDFGTGYLDSHVCPSGFCRFGFRK
mmetsp:Transcript_42947/g.103937  ORF Transcript_42947/g.103937 Transcript_42947/m.103937 type:complete len:155 (+) Transcript_42947:116-580(+)